MNIETKNAWTKEDFYNEAQEITSSNLHRRDADNFGLYGAFHTWKANDTNFHEIATAILKSATMPKAEQNMAYTNLVVEVAQKWISFCESVGVTQAVAVGLAHQYLSRELAKIQNWVSKTA